MFPLLVLLSACGGHKDHTGETGEKDRIYPCEKGIVLDAEEERVLPEAVWVGSGRHLGAVAVGDLAGTGAPQIYVSDGQTVTRLDGEGWATPLDLWSQGDDDGATPLVADLTGDGQVDLAIGKPGSDDGAGQVVVFAGPVVEPLTWDVPNLQVKGTSGAGSQPQAADLDGDGGLDLLLKESTRVWIRFGPVDPASDTIVPLDSSLDASWSDSNGIHVTDVVAGDVTGDGLGDLVLLTLVDDDTADLRVVPGPLSPGAHTIDEAPLVVTPPDDAPFFPLEGLVNAIPSLQVADMDGDGQVDVGVLALGEDLYPTLLLYLCPLSATSMPVARVDVMGVPAALGDVDGDGAQDLVELGGYLNAIPEDHWVSVLAGPLVERAPVDWDTCHFPVSELWWPPPGTASPASAWVGDLDGIPPTDTVLVGGGSVVVGMGS